MPDPLHPGLRPYSNQPAPDLLGRPDPVPLPAVQSTGLRLQREVLRPALAGEAPRGPVLPLPRRLHGPLPPARGPGPTSEGLLRLGPGQALRGL